MTREQLAQKLLKTYSNSWGHVCNDIQDTAEVKLSQRQFTTFLIRANKDNEMSEGQDFVYFNGQVFDWKLFKTKAKEIVLAFLDYFTDSQLSKMYEVEVA